MRRKSTYIANGRDRDATGQSRWRNAEHVWVEPVRMHELNPLASEICAESPLAAKHSRAAQTAYRVLGNRNLHGFDFFEKFTFARQATDAHVESRSIQTLCYISELALRSANRKHSEEFQNLD